MTPEDQTELPQPLTPSTSAKDGRRRLLRGGLAAAPALLTLTTRPVVAGDCFSASAAVSMSSRTSANRVSCTLGKTPAAWVNTAAWPAPAKRPNDNGKNGTSFEDFFGKAGGFYTTNDTKTLLYVLGLNSNTGMDGLAKHLVAAYLNRLSEATPLAVLSLATIRDMWDKSVSPGWYEPTAGIKWYPDSAVPATGQGGLIAWLKTTMPVSS